MKQAYKKQYKCLGENIAFYRKRREMTQEKLSEIVGVENVHISHIETGDRAASLDLVFAIADALGVEPYRLFQEKD